MKWHRLLLVLLLLGIFSCSSTTYENIVGPQSEEGEMVTISQNDVLTSTPIEEVDLDKVKCEICKKRKAAAAFYIYTIVNEFEDPKKYICASCHNDVIMWYLNELKYLDDIVIHYDDGTVKSEIEKEDLEKTKLSWDSEEEVGIFPVCVKSGVVLIKFSDVIIPFGANSVLACDNLLTPMEPIGELK